MPKLTKLVRIDNKQFCHVGNDVICFVLENCVWVQHTFINNRLVYAVPQDRPMVYHADSFLNSEAQETTLKKLYYYKSGLFTANC